MLQAQYHANYYQKNKSRLDQKRRDYIRLNRKRIATSLALYYQKNKEKLKERSNAYRQSHKKERNVYLEKRRAVNNARRRTRFREDIKYKLACVLRARLTWSVKANQRSGVAIRNLGCSIEDLKKHLEGKFTSKMSWSNYNYRGWHIDHIKPLVSFDLTDPEQLKEACHYTNLQPMWGVENISKGAKFL